MAERLLQGTSVLGEVGYAEKHRAHHQLMQDSDST